MASTEALPRVALFALGGTIATPLQGLHAPGVGLTADDLLSAIPELRKVAAVTATTFRATMSAALTLEDVVALSAAIAHEQTTGAGIVVTMGTDSLEEVAYALDLLLTSHTPVVVTGAMRNAGGIGADGPANLLDAVRLAASDLAVGAGVLVSLSGEIHAARHVRKTHATSLAAFTSPGSGPLGSITEGRVRLALHPSGARPHLTSHEPVPPVALVRMCLGDDGRTLDALQQLGYQGAVLEVFGAGHVGAALMPRIRTLAAAMPVLFASRTGSGDLYEATGTFPGSESDLKASGLEPAGDLDGLKARVLLSLALSGRTEWRSTVRDALN